ncbi:MAG: family 16 glycoside hydrolase, partial [Pirellulales bacterium]
VLRGGYTLFMDLELDWVGKTLGKYTILQRLGQGGMGVVYLGHDARLDRRVAIKVLPERVANDEVQRERFLREARAAARFSHPNVVTIHEIDEHDGVYFLAMELMAGSTLDLLRAYGKLRWENATRAIAAVCRALVAAHAAGLVHRDIKPSNILRSSSGEVKLSDFGLAKSTGNEASLTTTNTVLGTPTYMSPEQCRSEPIDGRSDLYSLGCSYYELLTGRPPYVAEQSIQVCLAHLLNPIPDASVDAPGVPPACAAIVARAMAKEPRDRYSDAAEMLADLRRVLADPDSPTSVNVPASPASTVPASTPPASTPPADFSLGVRQSLHSDERATQGETRAASTAPEPAPVPNTPSSSPTPFVAAWPASPPARRVAKAAPRASRLGLHRRQWFKPALVAVGSTLGAGAFYGVWRMFGDGDVDKPASTGASPTSEPAAGSTLSLTPSWQPLFNGRNLDGWRVLPASGDWKVEQGVLIGRAGGRTSYLFHDRPAWRDFELLAEFRINSTGNSGIFFRCTPNDSLPTGYEAHIDVWNPGRLHRTGLAGVQGIDPKAHAALEPNGWNRYNLRVVGNRMTLRVNDVTTLDYVDQENGAASGHLALQCYEPNTVVEFRRVDVRAAE